MYVTSVCTGSLVLAAVGKRENKGRGGLLLQRYGVRATTHWMFLDQLRQMGVEAVKGERVVRTTTTVPCWEEGKVEAGGKTRDVVIYTGGGVTAGIDFAFAVVRDVWGEDVAQSIQLQLEYFPAIPSGLLTCRPETLGKGQSEGQKRVLQSVESKAHDLKKERVRVCARIKARLDGEGEVRGNART